MDCGRKTCPYCGEEILIQATKCKHCGEWIIKGDATKNKDIIENFGVGVIKIIKFVASCIAGYYLIAFIGLVIFLILITISN